MLVLERKSKQKNTDIKASGENTHRKNTFSPPILLFSFTPNSVPPPLLLLQLTLSPFSEATYGTRSEEGLGVLWGFHSGFPLPLLPPHPFSLVQHGSSRSYSPSAVSAPVLCSSSSDLGVPSAVSHSFSPPSACPAFSPFSYISFPRGVTALVEGLGCILQWVR